MSANPEPPVPVSTPVRNSATPIPGEPDRLGRFEPVRFLGRGSFGSVWEVRDPARPARRLALKVLDPLRASAPVEEYRVSASIRHPAVVSALECHRLPESPLGTDAPYILMPYCDGAPLTGVERPEDLVSITHEVLTALDAIHAAGWRHGDLKPENVLVEWQGGETPRVHVLDFGLARSNSEEAAGRSHGGTPRYLSPESLRGFRPTGSSDLYSLGVLLFECLTGPIDTPIASFLLEVRQGTFSQRVASTKLPSPFDRLIPRLVDPNPESRVPTAAAALALLEGGRPSDRKRIGRSGKTIATFEAAAPVGLDSILRKIASEIDALASETRRRPALLAIDGSPQSGKSRLLAEARTLSICKNVTALDWLSALANLRAREADRPVESVDDWRFAPGAPSATAEDLLAARWVDSLSSRPTVLTVDDADLLPPAEQRTLASIVFRLLTASRHGRDTSVFILLATRSKLEEGPLSEWWRRTSTLPWVSRETLPTWGKREALQFLDGVLGSPRSLGSTEDLLTKSRLSPGRVRKTLVELARLGALRHERGTWLCDRLASQGLPPLPDDEAEFATGWEQLSPDQRDLLGIAALSTAPLSVEELAGTVAQSVDHVAASLASIERLDVTTSLPGNDSSPATRDRRSSSLRLPRAQRARILRALGRLGRRALHERLAIAPIPARLRVEHEVALGRLALDEILARAGADDGLAGRWLARVARDVRRETTERATAALRLAERLHRRGEDPAATRWIELAERLAPEHERSFRQILDAENRISRGHLAEAEAAVSETRDAIPAQHELWPRLKSCDGQLALLHGDAAGAMRISLEGLETPGRFELALLSLNANAAAQAGSFGAAESAFRRGIELAKSRGIDAAEAAFLANYGRLLERRGRLADAASVLRDAARRFEDIGLWAQAARTLGNLYVVQRRAGEYQDAHAVLEKSLELYREGEDSDGCVVSEANRAILAREVGLWGTALRRFEAVERALSGPSSAAGKGLLTHPALVENRALLALHFGDGERLASCLELRRPPNALSPAEILPETLLLEWRLVVADIGDVGRLAHFVERRPLDERDAAFVFEFLEARVAARLEKSSEIDGTSHDGGPELPEELSRLRSEGRELLATWSRSSPRATFFLALLDAIEARGDAPRSVSADRALRDALESCHLRHARLAALAHLASFSVDRELSEWARARIPGQLDEILFDLTDAERTALLKTPLLEEATNVSRPNRLHDPKIRTTSANDFAEVMRFARSILEENSLDRLLETMVDTAIELTGAKRGFLAVRRRGRLHYVVSRTDGVDLESPEVYASHTILERTLSDGTARVTTDAREDATLHSIASVEELGLRSVISVPLRTEGAKIVGAIYLDNAFEEGVFTSRELELVESFCSLAGLAWENARKKEEIQKLVGELRDANAYLRSELDVTRRDAAQRARLEERQFEGLVGDSPRMRSVHHLVSVVAPTDIPVLVTGESGTGKELIARAIHRLSNRNDRPFVAENCAAVPANLLESTLFGHVKGAFTGADSNRPGLFELANGGTLFLDEIGDLPADMQTRLLRVLQEGEVRPIGSDRVIQVDVRIVAATNRNVLREIEAGRFRQDLYYRLQGAEVNVPPLRERPADIDLLVKHFLERQSGDGEVKRVSVETLDLLTRYPWPGNVRELENEVRRLALMCPGSSIGPEFLSTVVRSGSAAVPQGSGSPTSDEVRPLRIVEQEAILSAMQRLQGHRGKVAKALGISRSTLYLKLKDIGFGGSDGSE